MRVALLGVILRSGTPLSIQNMKWHVFELPCVIDVQIGPAAKRRLMVWPIYGSNAIFQHFLLVILAFTIVKNLPLSKDFSFDVSHDSELIYMSQCFLIDT